MVCNLLPLVHFLLQVMVARIDLRNRQIKTVEKIVMEKIVMCVRLV